MAKNGVKIYLLTAIVDIQPVAEVSQQNNTSVAGVIGSRSLGCFLTLDEAKTTVRSNQGKLHKDCYNYIVIEEVSLGGYIATEPRSWWYRWLKTNYRPIRKPRQLY